jgi:hypothetical protein
MRTPPDARLRPRSRPPARNRPGGWGFACLLLALTAVGLDAQSQWDALLHVSPLSYTRSDLKDDGFTAGLYTTWGARWIHLGEFGAALTRLHYTDGYTLEQWDLTAAYNRFGSRGSGRAGLHLIRNDDPATDAAWITFAGANVYRVGVWSAGAEGAFSRYPGPDRGLRVVQVAPTAGFTAGDAAGSIILGVTVRGYFIHLLEDAGLGGRNFGSGELGASVTTGPLTLRAVAWGGEQAFAVRNAGFLVFNLPEVHTGGVGGGARWVVSRRSALSAGLHVERFRDPGATTDALVRTLSLSLGVTL